MRGRSEVSAINRAGSTVGVDAGVGRTDGKVGEDQSTERAPARQHDMVRSDRLERQAGLDGLAHRDRHLPPVSQADDRGPAAGAIRAQAEQPHLTAARGGFLGQAALPAGAEEGVKTLEDGIVDGLGGARRSRRRVRRANRLDRDPDQPAQLHDQHQRQRHFDGGAHPVRTGGERRPDPCAPVA
jgi:hypothetical protein